MLLLETPLYNTKVFRNNFIRSGCTGVPPYSLFNPKQNILLMIEYFYIEDIF